MFWNHTIAICECIFVLYCIISVLLVLLAILVSSKVSLYESFQVTGQQYPYYPDKRQTSVSLDGVLHLIHSNRCSYITVSFANPAISLNWSRFVFFLFFCFFLHLNP